MMKCKPINAVPSLNGDTPDTFRASGCAINVAAQDALNLLRVHASEVCNGRNYQHLDNPNEARAADLVTINEIIAGLEAMQALGIAMFKASEVRANG